MLETVMKLTAPDIQFNKSQDLPGSLITTMPSKAVIQHLTEDILTCYKGA